MASNSPQLPAADGPSWCLIQAALSVFCLIGMEPLNKLPRLMVPGKAGVLLLIDSITGLVLAVPVIAMQLRLGSKINSGIVGMFSKFCPLFKGIAVAFLVRSLQSTFQTQQTSSHALLYFWYSLSPEPTWSSCNQLRSPLICEMKDDSGNVTAAPSTLYNVTADYTQSSCHSSEMEFYKQNILGNVTISNDTLGQLDIIVPSTLSFHRALAASVSWLIVLILAIGGVKTTGWMVVFLVVVLTGSVSGILGYGWYYQPIDPVNYLGNLYTFSAEHFVNITEVISTEMVRDSVQNAFYSFVLVSGIYPSIGKFVGKSENKQSMIVIVCWIVVTLFPHFLLVALAPFMNVTECGPSTGEELLFVTWPSLMTQFNFSCIVGATLYIVVFILGLLFSGLIVSIVSDCLTEKPCRSKQAVCYCLTTIFICLACLGLSLLFCTDVGHLWIRMLATTSTNIDYIYMLLLLLFMCIFLGKTSSYQGTLNVLRNVWFTIAAFVLFAVAIMFPLRSRFPDGYGWLIPSSIIIFVTLGGAMHTVVNHLLWSRPGHERKCRVLCCGVPDEMMSNTITPTFTEGPSLVLTVGPERVETPAPAYTSSVQQANRVHPASPVQPATRVHHAPPVLHTATTERDAPAVHHPIPTVRQPVRSAPQQMAVQQSAPPYYLYEERPLHPSPRGQYAIPKEDELDQGVFPGS